MCVYIYTLTTGAGAIVLFLGGSLWLSPWSWAAFLRQGIESRYNRSNPYHNSVHAADVSWHVLSLWGRQLNARCVELNVVHHVSSWFIPKSGFRNPKAAILSWEDEPCLSIKVPSQGKAEPLDKNRLNIFQPILGGKKNTFCFPKSFFFWFRCPKQGSTGKTNQNKPLVSPTLLYSW